MVTSNLMFRHFWLIFGSMTLTFLLVAGLAQAFYQLLIKLGIRKQIRQETLDGKTATLFRKLHMKKSGTPTMGGILIWGAVLVVVMISPLLVDMDITQFSLINRNETYLPLFALVTTAILGAIDDYMNIKSIGKGKGLSGKFKMAWLTLFALLGGLWFYFKLGYTTIHIPPFGDIAIGWWYIPIFMLVIIASANAVNITDGLDGLAAGLLIIAFGALGIIAYLHGLVILSALCAVIVGATLSFLWFNIPPALFYMGDTGSLALGATMGVIAMMTDSVILLPFIAFIFIIETLSVIIQLASKKFFGKKVFHIAPIHHHFEHIGWPEFRVTMRFWIAGAFIAGLGLLIQMTAI